jgi:flagellar hook-length control protein FliK
VESQIGSDIAKLLGNLGKSKASATQSGSQSEAGSSFKRALVASERLQAKDVTGKPLPGASPTEAASPTEVATPAPDTGRLKELQPSAGATASQSRTTTPMPEFDLVVTGGPAERPVIVDLARKSGFSPAAVENIFSLRVNDGETGTLPQKSLTLAVAQTLFDWSSTNLKRTVDPSQVQATVDPSQVQQTVDVSKVQQTVDLSQMQQTVDLFALKKAMNDGLKDVSGSVLLPDESVDQANIAELVNAVASVLKPLLSQSADKGESPAAPASGTAAHELSSKIQVAVGPAVERWVASHLPVEEAETSRELLLSRLTTAVTPLISDSTAAVDRVVAQNPLEQNSQEMLVLTRQLQSTLASWVTQSMRTEQGAAVPEQWVRELAGSLAPEVAGWAAKPSEDRPGVMQLAARISPVIEQAMQTVPALAQVALSGASQESYSGTATSEISPRQSASIISAPIMGLSGVTQSQLSAAKNAAVSQPERISLTVTGPSWEIDGADSKRAVARLMQGVLPSKTPSPSEVAGVSQGTLERFAVRGAGMGNGDGTGPVRSDLTIGTEKGKTDKSLDIKSGSLETATTLRNVVTARSLELARMIPQVEKPLAGAPEVTSQLSSAGSIPSEGTDSSAPRLAAQSELSFRQAMTTNERPALSDAARANQFSLSQSMPGREMASRAISEALGQRLAANIAAGHYRLTFNVNPKELGAIDVVMEMRDGRLDAQISASNAVTRDLLGDSLPRLREALQQTGINLAQLQVSSDAQQNGAHSGDGKEEMAQERFGNEGLLAESSEELISEDLELGLDPASVDFWA